ncbi:unnamed protein product [Effrenium voratum]|uniref:Uncharacterized protein n=1 Tax=Effrenium voratum TaxID=2562239 RepID=A0AA36IRW6_9DINO|nr:unnamed protein product [Effrenium voratum]
MVSDATSLRVLARRRLLDGMVKHVLWGAALPGSSWHGSGYEGKESGRTRYLVLIADKWTLQLLERVCQMHDLLLEGIALVEAIDSPREGLPLDALYFLSPTRENMERLVEDVLLQQVAQSPEAVGRLSSFAELNVSTLCYDERSFHLQESIGRRRTPGTP